MTMPYMIDQDIACLVMKFTGLRVTNDHMTKELDPHFEFQFEDSLTLILPVISAQGVTREGV
jgi:hypothetical protein